MPMKEENYIINLEFNVTETQGGKEELMQIDCEVTGVLSLKKPKEK